MWNVEQLTEAFHAALDEDFFVDNSIHLSKEMRSEVVAIRNYLKASHSYLCWVNEVTLLQPSFEEMISFVDLVDPHFQKFIALSRASGRCKEVTVNSWSYGIRSMLSHIREMNSIGSSGSGLPDEDIPF